MQSSSDQPLLKIENVRKRFAHAEVLRGLTFDVKASERLALMGPSGGGKSTLLNCIGGLDTVDEGKVFFAGKDLGQMSPEDRVLLRKSDITFVFQFFHLLPTLTVEENIEFPLRLLKLSAKDRAKRIKLVLEAIGLEDRKKAYPNLLSGGEQQRVALARALAPRPRLILADEPTGNLDSQTGTTILNLIKDLTTEFKTALIMATHSEEATRICHRTLHLRDGTIVSAELCEKSGLS